MAGMGAQLTGIEWPIADSRLPIRAGRKTERQLSTQTGGSNEGVIDTSLALILASAKLTAETPFDRRICH